MVTIEGPNLMETTMTVTMITRTITDAALLATLPDSAVLYSADGSEVRSARVQGVRFWLKAGDPKPRFGAEVLAALGPLSYQKAATPADIPTRKSPATHRTDLIGNSAVFW